MLLEERLGMFIHEYRSRLEPETIDLYQKAVRQLTDFCEKPFENMTSRDIRSWLFDLENNGYKPSTINTRLFGIKLFCKYLIEEGEISHNPAKSIPIHKLDDKLPKYLKMEQLTQLREHVKETIRERAIIEVLYATGVRINELANMKKEDIIWPERLIHISNGKRKKARIVLFTRNCEEYLKAYLEGRCDDLPFVFLNRYGSRPLGIRAIQKNFKVYQDQLGIPMTPHTLRHTFAAHLAIKGMPLECIQTLLGHIDPHQTHLYARLYSEARKLMYDEWM